MLAVHIGKKNVYFVSGKFGTDLKVDACAKVPYNMKVQSLPALIFSNIIALGIKDNDISFVLESASSVLKYITVDKSAISLENEIIADLQKLMITRVDFAISYNNLGGIKIDGQSKQNVLVAAAKKVHIAEMIDVTHQANLTIKGIETGVSSMYKLIKIMPQIIEGQYSIVMIGEGDYLTLTLYYGTKMLYSKYVQIDTDSDEVLNCVSHMTQYLGRIEKRAKIAKIFYTVSRKDTKNLVSQISKALAIKTERLVPSTSIKSKNGFLFDDFAFMLGALDVKNGINLYRDLDVNSSRERVKLELDMLIEERELLTFSKRLSAAVYSLGGDVKSLKIDKLSKKSK